MCDNYVVYIQFPDSSVDILLTILLRYPDFVKTMHLAHITVPYPVAAVFTVFGSKDIINSSIDVLADKVSEHSAVQSWLKLFNNNLTIFANRCKNKGGVLKSSWPRLAELSNSYVTIPMRFNRLRYALLRSLPTPSGFEQPPNDDLASSRLGAELGLKLVSLLVFQCDNSSLYLLFFMIQLSF